MKFKEIIQPIVAEVSAYRRLIFTTIITALLIGKGSKHVQGIVQEFGVLLAGTSATRKRFYCLLNSSKLPWAAIRNVVYGMLRPLVNGRERLLLVLDDTTYGKSGKHIEGCATHFNHAAKTNESDYIHGHCRVLVGLLEDIHGRWASLPLAQANYVPKKAAETEDLKIHPHLRKKTKYARKRRRHELWLQTKLGIAAQLVNGIREQFAKPTLVVADSWFGVRSLLKELRRRDDLDEVHMLSRLRISCKLFQVPAAPAPGKRGRRRKYGEALPELRKLAFTNHVKRRKVTITLYGRQRTLEIGELICVSQALKCQVKVVFIYNKNGTIFPLVCTDLSLSATTMIEYYAARWKIESGFKELKHELGALDSQCRKRTAVENHFNLCCLAMTLGWLYAESQPHPPPRRHPRRRSRAYAFADVRRAIARELKTDRIKSNLCSKMVNTAAKIIRDQIFCLNQD